MTPYCISDLTERIGGHLRLGAMPPLGGRDEPIRRIVTRCSLVQPGDVYWGLWESDENGAWRAEEAYARGALGVVAGGRRLTPWSGTFSLEVADARLALWELALAAREEFAGIVIAVVGAECRTIAERIRRAVAAGAENEAEAPLADDPAHTLLQIVALGDADCAVFEWSETPSPEQGELLRLMQPHLVLSGDDGALAAWSSQTPPHAQLHQGTTEELVQIVRQQVAAAKVSFSVGVCSTAAPNRRAA